MAATPANVAFMGSLLFALFLLGWGCLFCGGPWPTALAAPAAWPPHPGLFPLHRRRAFSHTVWQWACSASWPASASAGMAMAGTYVAESCRRTAARRAPATCRPAITPASSCRGAHFTVGAQWGWRAMFLCGAAPVLVTLFTLARVREPARWAQHKAPAAINPLAAIFSRPYLRRTLVNSALVSIAIIGLWAGTVYEPTALLTLAAKAGFTPVLGTGSHLWALRYWSIGTIVAACCCRAWRNAGAGAKTLGAVFCGMAIAIVLAFAGPFTCPGIDAVSGHPVLPGPGGRQFRDVQPVAAEQYPTRCAHRIRLLHLVGRFLGAGANFAIAGLIQWTGIAGPRDCADGIAFVIGLAVIPFAFETKRPSPCPRGRYKLRYSSRSRLFCTLPIALRAARPGTARLGGR